MTPIRSDHCATPAPPRFAEATLVVVVALAVLALTFSLSISKNLSPDEHQHIAAGALLVRDSLIPYKDYPFFHMPYLPFIYGGIYALSDHLLLSARLFSVVCATFAGVVIFCVSRRVFRERAGRLAVPLGAVALFVTASLFTYTTGLAWNQESAMLCALLSFAFYVAGFHSPRPGRWIFATALFLGLAIGIRITLAPLGGALILMVVWFPPTAGDRGRFFALAALGITLALLPAFILFAQTPENFLFGNLEFAKANVRFLERSGSAMTFVKKLRFMLDQIARNLPLVGAFVVTTTIAVLHARSSGRRLPREMKMVFLILPFLLTGALAPSPVYRQYFYPLLPFLVLGGVYAAASVADSAAWWKRTIICGALSVMVSTLLAVSSYRHLRQVFSPDEWVPLHFHERAVKLCSIVPRGGRILTLAPSGPLEAGLSIYPELATGLPAWRITLYVADERRAGLRLLDIPSLEKRMTTDPPAAFFFSPERYPEPFLRALAQAHGFTSVTAFEKHELWVRATP